MDQLNNINIPPKSVINSFRIVFEVKTTNRPILKKLWRFGNVLNQYNPKINVSAYYENVEYGFVLFIDSMKDFYRLYQHTPSDDFLDSLKPFKKEVNEESPIKFEYNVKKKPPTALESDLFAPIEQFWKRFAISSTIYCESDKSSKIEVYFPSEAIFYQIDDYLIEIMNSI